LIVEGNKMMKVKRARILQIIIALTALSLMAGAGVASTKAKKKKKESAAAAAAEPAQPAPAAPRQTNGSLFMDGAPGADLLSDFRPRRVGDIVFIDILESSAASVSSGAKNDRQSGALGGAVIGAAPLPPNIAGGAGAIIGALGTRKFEGKGSTERKSDLRARIAARVVEVLPNGDLQIEAEKTVKINKEEEVLELSGLVRQRDVLADNAVPSTAVADLRVKLNGKGVASAHNAPGWLARLIEKISPF
jgi:flagellar L-ring protein precursor FlgH